MRALLPHKTRSKLSRSGQVSTPGFEGGRGVRGVQGLSGQKTAENTKKVEKARMSGGGGSRGYQAGPGQFRGGPEAEKRLKTRKNQKNAAELFQVFRRVPSVQHATQGSADCASARLVIFVVRSCLDLRRATTSSAARRKLVTDTSTSLQNIRSLKTVARTKPNCSNRHVCCFVLLGGCLSGWCPLSSRTCISKQWTRSTCAGVKLSSPGCCIYKSKAS